MKTIGELAVAYMRDQMAMPDATSDQEQNWILGHLVTFGQSAVKTEREVGVAFGQARDFRTRRTSFDGDEEAPTCAVASCPHPAKPCGLCHRDHNKNPPTTEGQKGEQRG